MFGTRRPGIFIQSSILLAELPRLSWVAFLKSPGQILQVRGRKRTIGKMIEKTVTPGDSMSRKGCLWLQGLTRIKKTDELWSLWSSLYFIWEEKMLNLDSLYFSLAAELKFIF